MSSSQAQNVIEGTGQTIKAGMHHKGALLTTKIYILDSLSVDRHGCACVARVRRRRSEEVERHKYRGRCDLGKGGSAVASQGRGSDRGRALLKFTLSSNVGPKPCACPDCVFV
eukprot:6204070-Pleurochrysis_carterae.AAC.3